MPLFTASSQLVPALACTQLDPQEVIGNGAVQPLVYLLDRAGAGFHYRYEWEDVGPFSVELHNDIANLGPDDFDDCEEAEEHVQEAAARIRPLLEPPAVDGPSLPVWLQLLATVDSLHEWPLLNGDSGTASYVKRHVDERLIEAAQQRLRTVFDDAGVTS